MWSIVDLIGLLVLHVEKRKVKIEEWHANDVSKYESKRQPLRIDSTRDRPERIVDSLSGQLIGSFVLIAILGIVLIK